MDRAIGLYALFGSKPIQCVKWEAVSVQAGAPKPITSAGRPGQWKTISRFVLPAIGKLSEDPK